MVRRSALSREPNKPQTGGGLTQSLQRLSPGVYRDAGGQLTNQAGRPLQQQPNRPPQSQFGPQPTSNPQGVISGIRGTGNLMGTYRPGSGPGDFTGAVQQEQNLQMQNPSYTPQNYFNTPYKPWWLPPQNSPWWYQPQPLQQQYQAQELANIYETYKPQAQSVQLDPRAAAITDASKVNPR